MLLALLAGLGTLACRGEQAKPPPGSTPAVPLDELNVGEDRGALLEAARRLIEADPVATLITVDSVGRGRARTVDCGGPDDHWSFWVATRPGTRKVEQIEELSHVTLHFETDDEGSYVSVMGRAVVHSDDVELFEQKNPIDPELMPVLFPDYPADYRLIEIRPAWLELLSPTVEASDDTWRPQAVVFDPHPPSSSR